ncbi:MAG: DUF4131 domain-containing protein, partial [Planctomycetia bacterium]|nr:DUF4131 domain-containing protein [Planctomycetia bacterium]
MSVSQAAVRPLVPPAVAFALGVSAAGASPPALATTAAGAVVLAALAVLAHRLGRRRTAGAAMLGAAFAAGAARLETARRPDPRDVAAFAGEGSVATVEGVVTRAPEAFGAAGETDGAAPGSFLVLAAEVLESAGERREVRGGLRVVAGEGTPALREGDRVRAAGWLSPPRGARNPGEFDFAAHLARPGIRATLRVPRAAEFEAAGKGPWWLRLRGAARA